MGTGYLLITLQIFYWKGLLDTKLAALRYATGTVPAGLQEQSSFVIGCYAADVTP